MNLEVLEGQFGRRNGATIYLLYNDAVLPTDPYVPLSCFDTTDCFRQILSSGLLNHKLKIDLTLRLLMSYIYRAPILDVYRSHTTTHHSR